MTGSLGYRTGTASVTLPASLGPAQLRDGVREALQSQLAATGEWLAQYDYGPPRRADDDSSRSYDVMYRTGPPAGEQTGPAPADVPPQLGV